MHVLIFGEVPGKLLIGRICVVLTCLFSDIKAQEAIVTNYHNLETRKPINEQLKESIKPLCPVLMKGVVEEMEFKL